MSFGYSVGDFLSLAQLAWTVVDNTRKACGEHDEFAREVNHLHTVLRRLSDEDSKPDSYLKVDKDDRVNEFRNIIQDCRRLLRALNKQLARYNALTGEKRSFAKMWQQVRFGNGMMKSLSDVRLKVTTYTSALTLYMNLLSAESQGRVERHMYTHGGELREMRRSINLIAATMQASHTEGSILTTYTDDDKAVWKLLRRELIRKGFSSSVLKKNKAIIQRYLLELGERGVLDERLSREHAQGSESSDTARSELNPSGSEQVLRPSSPPPSKVPGQDQCAETSRSKDKGKAREPIEDTQASKSGGISTNEFAIRTTVDRRDIQTEINAEESDHSAGDTISSEMTSSTEIKTDSDKTFLISASEDKIQGIGFLERTHLNCEARAGPSSERYFANGEYTTKGEDNKVLESSSETSQRDMQGATCGDDTPPKENEIHKELDAGEGKAPCKISSVKVFSEVVDLEDGSEYPVVAIYPLLPPTRLIPPPKTVGSEWFQWRAEGSAWRITELDRSPLRQIPVPDLKTRPSLPRVVVVQAIQKKDAEPRQGNDGAANDSSSKISNPTRTSPNSSPDASQAAPETQGATNPHLRPPPSPETATFVVGDRRGRTRTFYYRDLLGRPPLSSPSSWRRRGPIYYNNTRTPRAIWQPHSSHTEEASDEEDWVDDPESPLIIEVTYTNEFEPGAEFSRPGARTGSPLRAATVVVDAGRRRIRDYRGYYRNYYRSISRRDDSRRRHSRSRSARSGSESTRTVYEYERTIYYGRRQRCPVYEYDGRRGTVYNANSRPTLSRWASGYHPARFQYSVRHSSVVRRRISRTTTF